MGQKDLAKAMKRALKEGKEVDEALTELAEKEITPALLAQDSEEEEGAEEVDQGSNGKAARSEQRSNAAQ